MHRELPEEFITMMENLLHEESKDFFEAMQEKPVVSVRLNKRKQIDLFPDNTPVPWCRSGVYLESRPEFIFDPLLHAGAYYVQDASSMIYETVTELIIAQFLKEKGNNYYKVLDLCASPGGKTTAIINGLPDGCDVLANEYVKKRVEPLRQNLDRWGYPSVKVANHDSSYYGGQAEEYDIVAVDAPCSGEGMMRKDDYALVQWSSTLVNQCSSLQKEILTNAVKALKPGGFLIYSTCTFNRMENEDNAEYIYSHLGLIPFDTDFPEEWGIMPGIDTSLPVYRFMPHKTKGEGLFLAIFRKPGEWKPSLKKETTTAKTIKKKQGYKDTIPDIGEVLSVKKNLLPEIPRIELTLDQALAYLRRESIPSPPESQKGIVILTYKGLNLGLGKNIGSRINNLYPKELRILKR